MKNKSFSIVCIFLLIVLLFSNFRFVKANSLITYVDFDSDLTFDAPQIDNEGYPYYFVHNPYGTCYTILDDNKGYFYLDSSSPRRIYASCSSKCYFLNNTGDGWYLVASNSPGKVSDVDSVDQDFGVLDFHCTVYSDVNKSDVFFQKPLQGITQTLVAETEKAQIAEQIKAMIVGFLKYLIALVISVIAFYKGWKFLSMQLRKS